MPVLELERLEKTFASPTPSARVGKPARQLVLDIPRFAMDAGEHVALEGASGSGKTTLLNIIAGLSRPDSGKVALCGTDLTRLSEAQRDAARARHLGYVFQTFNLLQGYSALENVLLGMSFGPGPDRDHARALLERLGLGDRLGHRPRQLSIGQQQRVALARALANRPDLVLADEPTGNLDPRRSREALELIREICVEEQAALLLVSHDREVLQSFARRVPLATINRAGNDDSKDAAGSSSGEGSRA